ncbi:hypothetical protein I6A84_38340 [Frankia sp. CNm7]|uniref:Uncharacterized protein n=1 Tax=Frankia nepalensis TaxID=1836974 RepID=A0A937REL1_9ACTN|nr:hypothetical protein [Frankia nepalensis]MBL7500093.1 hypothetical protein [Frankia nepalensis]MBL7512450.1 hypothetical protein [Frankia nepalensis]MBL7523747.1 hypothetical protein [Frankia nepalensis]MBL7628587.1 hypothetical protein [Frankia nepalensis]
MTVAGLPPEGRALARAVTALVGAAGQRDAAALRAACAQLRARDETVARELLHRLTLGLVERTFPDGVDADDVSALLDEVARLASPWLAGLDPYAVVIVLAGTLSIHPPDDAPRPSLDPDALPIACALVVDHLLTRLGVRLPAELTRAFEELRTAQTMEIP